MGEYNIMVPFYIPEENCMVTFLVGIDLAEVDGTIEYLSGFMDG